MAIRGSIPDRKGYWYPPTVLAPMTNDDRAAREEIFGPVACVIPFGDEELPVTEGLLAPAIRQLGVRDLRDRLGQLADLGQLNPAYHHPRPCERCHIPIIFRRTHAGTRAGWRFEPTAPYCCRRRASLTSASIRSRCRGCIFSMCSSAGSFGKTTSASA